MCGCAYSTRVPVTYETRAGEVRKFLACKYHDRVEDWPNWRRGLKDRVRNV